jgi:hypothetical protein
MYVDGWNFYHSLVNAHIKPYGWCDFPLLARRQTSESDSEVSVKYFTSADRPNPEKIADRQKPIWWRALDFIGCQRIEGEFRSTTEEVEEHIRFGSQKWREKRTDIALASHMVKDCSRIEAGEQPGTFRWLPGFDRAILLTQDTDFIPAVRIVSEEPFNRSVLVLLPPSEAASEENAYRMLEQGARGRKVTVKQLRLADLAHALLPRIVGGPAGEHVVCHHTWMWREKYESEIARRVKPGTTPSANLSRAKGPSSPGRPRR